MVWIVVAWAAVAQADGPAIRDTISDAGSTGGLAVFVGQSDGVGEIELAQTGRWLVLTVVPDEASSRRIRDVVEEAGLSGLVPVRGRALIKTGGRLYASCEDGTVRCFGE